VDIVNVYDPMDRIVYRHMDSQQDPYVIPVTTTRSINRLPAGYANGSPRTYLGRTRRPNQATEARARHDVRGWTS
jgi:hypothetical protein